MACYGLFSVVDPTLLVAGAGAAAKGINLAKLFRSGGEGTAVAGSVSPAAQGLKASELVNPERFNSFADKLKPEQFSAMLRGSGTANDAKARVYVGDGLNHAPPPGQVTSKKLRVFKAEDNDQLRLLTIKQFEALPNGTVLESIAGKKVIKGVDPIDLDTRGNQIGFGFRTSELDKPERYIGNLNGQTIEELAITKNEVDKAGSTHANFFKTIQDEDFKRIQLSSKNFQEQVGKNEVEQLVSTKMYRSSGYSSNGARSPQEMGLQVDSHVIVKFAPKTGSQPMLLEGTITSFNGKELIIRDSSGVVHRLADIFGTIDNVLVRAPQPTVASLHLPAALQPVDPNYVNRIAVAAVEASQAATKATEAREVLLQGSTMAAFNSTAEKRVFFSAAKTIRSEPFKVAGSREAAVNNNIIENARLGRVPRKIDSNGLPVFAPGESHFRAMVVKPDGHAGARAILDTDGWKSGFDRGVKIEPSKLGSNGNGATRLSDKASVEDAVVEFVGPKMNVGPGFESGIAFPRDSRIVGTASSSAVAEVAMKTAGNLPEGSFIMITEIVPRNRDVINSKTLFEGRQLGSKYPLQYNDGGVEHAVTGVSRDEIVNVIILPLNK